MASNLKEIFIMVHKDLKNLIFRSWFFIPILLIQMLFLLMYCSNQPNCRIYFTFPQKLTANSPYSNQCPLGRVFVYEMLPKFNQDLIENCEELNSWDSGCPAMANEGFGIRATGIAGIVPKNLIPAWYFTDQYTLDVVFHKRILNYKCRTTEAEYAAAFYIPFYAGLAVGKYMWAHANMTERDKYCVMMLKWVQEQPYWTQSNGWNHFLTMGQPTWDFRRPISSDGYGSSCLNMPGMQNITRLLVERYPQDYLDISVPYPTGFHPRSESEIHQWQDYVRHRRRSSLFCFVGGPRGYIKNDFRGLLLDYCKNESDFCRHLDCYISRCYWGNSGVLETLLDSDFCLQPRGDSFTRRAMFDCMIAGSIPVFFWEESTYLQYEWYLPADPTNYSVFIHHNEVRNETSIIKAVLQRYSKEEVRKMRDTVIDLIPKFLYAKPKQGLGTIKDAFDVAIEGVLRRFKMEKQWGRNGN